jgi:hypothetical protein
VVSTQLGDSQLVAGCNGFASDQRIQFDTQAFEVCTSDFWDLILA